MKKSPPINFARKVIHLSPNNRIVGGSNSIQGVLSELATTATSANGGPPITHSCATLITGEFHTLLLDDQQAITTLTDLYDTDSHREGFAKTLVSKKFEIRSPCLNLLAASNQELLMDALPVHAYKSGFVGRMIVVYEEKRHTRHALTKPLNVPFVHEEFVPHLRDITKKNGPFLWGEGAKERYEEWYEKLETESMEDVTGFAERIDTHVLKVAMNIALARHGGLVLLLENIDEAIDKCTSVATAGKSAFHKGKAALADASRIVMEEMVRAPGYKLYKSALLKNHYQDFDVHELDRVVETLVQAGVLDTGNDEGIYYRLMPGIVAKLEAAKRKVSGA